MRALLKNRFDNHVFVQCSCGEEIIEICKNLFSFEDETEYFILFHGYYDRKKDKYASFYFKSKEEFNCFISQIYCYLYKEKGYSWFEDKYDSYKDKLPGRLKIQSDDLGDIEIMKYANYKAFNKDKPTWSIVINPIEAKKMYEELKSWVN